MTSDLSTSLSLLSTSIHIPDDVFLDIFRVCSPRTLAVCTQVSHRFLSLASSFLYRSVEIESRAQLWALFERANSVRVGGKKVGVVPPSIEPFLALEQIHSFRLLDSSSSLTGSHIPRSRFLLYLAPRLSSGSSPSRPRASSSRIS
ncbi:hypothetical protein BDY24DRAFT_401079 [Mrakia frigida]|uniref:uncharacterized protein n=1 Tax=Mrakia frigida TaxID=29902 RepID=UPI003FCC0F25